MSNSRIDETLTRIERNQRVRRLLTVLGFAALLFVTYRGLLFLEIQPAALVRQYSTWVTTITEQFLPPNFEDFTAYSQSAASERDITGFDGLFVSFADGGRHILDSLRAQQGIVGMSVVTIAIGFTGTVLGFPLALAFGVLGSERVVPFPFNFIFRGTMSTIRAIPAMVWILIYVPLAGISPVSAMLAVATDTIGNLGRLFTDELEEIDEGPIEAIGSTGADSAQVINFGMLSQVYSSFVAWTLYILEINVRIAISLGVLGAGGIGQYINLRIGMLEYSQAAAGIAMVIVIVLSVELTSSRLRARLRPGEHEGKGLVESLRDLADGNRWFGTDTERV